MIKEIYHYSPKIIDILLPEFYDRYKEHWPEEGSAKPTGLWVSIENEGSNITWFDWCKNEQFRLKNLKYKYRVKIKEDARILWLRSVPEIVAFGSLYAANDPYGLSRYFNRLPDDKYIYSISWIKVKQLYDGIIISPYQWTCHSRLETFWYNGWDCASGCIWNLEKVSLELETMIDVGSIEDKEELVDLEVVENVKDLR